jgi:hypothetical protein
LTRAKGLIRALHHTIRTTGSSTAGRGATRWRCGERARCQSGFSGHASVRAVCANGRGWQTRSGGECVAPRTSRRKRGRSGCGVRQVGPNARRAEPLAGLFVIEKSDELDVPDRLVRLAHFLTYAKVHWTVKQNQFFPNATVPGELLNVDFMVKDLVLQVREGFPDAQT